MTPPSPHHSPIFMTINQYLDVKLALSSFPFNKMIMSKYFRFKPSNGFINHRQKSLLLHCHILLQHHLDHPESVEIEQTVHLSSSQQYLPSIIPICLRSNCWMFIPILLPQSLLTHSFLPSFPPIPSSHPNILPTFPLLRHRPSSNTFIQRNDKTMFFSLEQIDDTLLNNLFLPFSIFHLVYPF
jgi:hypothetical protein